MPIRWTLLVLLVSACGIPTGGPDEVAPVEAAAAATADLDAYAFTWTATYELAEPDPTGRTSILVEGEGTVDAGSGDVDTVTRYDDAVDPVAESRFGVTPDIVETRTRIVGEEVWVRGLNVAFIDDEARPDYDRWYRLGDAASGYRDPFVISDVRPAEAVPVLIAPLIRSGSTAATVARDVVLDYGDRFPRSLFDFGLRIGGGDFDVSADLADGIVERVVIEGDDPGAGVDVFRFELRFEPLDRVAIAAPPEALEWSNVDR